MGQINSPYSRYGLGDMYNSRNVVNKGMGGLSTPTFDYQSVNLINPASYSRLQSVTFDVGIEYESRNLRDFTRTSKYNSANILFNYLALGMPLKKNKEGITVWGLAFGLRPVSRMNYSVTETGYLSGIDTFRTIYQGTGGASRAFMGTGFRVKGFSVGINAGFLIGQSDISSRRILYNDTISYYQARYQSKTSYSRFFADAGFQWDIKTGKNSRFRLAANGYLGQKLNASSDIRRETYLVSQTGELDSLDVILSLKNVKGTITMPAGYTVGLLFDRMDNFQIGAEWEQVKWTNYRYYGKPESFGNAEMFRMGAQWIPTLQPTKSYFKRVSYRAGFYTGKDYIVAGGSRLPVWAITAGAALPVRRWNNYSNQFTTINTSIEFGHRGKKTQPVDESLFKINLGLSLSDLWFFKRKYD